MKADEIQLVAYADGILSPHEREEVEAKIHRSVKKHARVKRGDGFRIVRKVQRDAIARSQTFCE